MIHVAARQQPRPAFTLIEFVLVMALLASVMAVVAPSLSGFFKQQNLEQEARRFLALTQFGRNEAVARGFPMVLWIDPGEQSYGLEPKAGYPIPEERPVEFFLNPTLRFNLTTPLVTGRWITAVEFRPDGGLAEASLPEVFLEERSGEERLIIAQTTNRLGYEILKEQDYALRVLRRR